MALQTVAAAGENQARVGNDMGGGPGAAADQQTRVVRINMQQRALLRRCLHRLNNVLPFGQRGDQRQIVVGGGRGIVLMQIVRHHGGVDAAVLNLYRHPFSKCTISEWKIRVPAATLSAAA